jgi:WD40 repeat protein
MKSSPNSIRFLTLFASVTLLLAFATSMETLAQGYNNNEWIFGNCPTGGHTYLSFGKGKFPTVQTLPENVIPIAEGSFNNAIAIDPITGQPLLYTNGVLVYDYSGNQIEGIAPAAPTGGLNGNFQGRQTVATGFLEYNPNGNKLVYIFYLSLTGQLQYALVDMNAPGQATGNQRPLGQITSKDQVIGPGQGAVLVVKTPASPSYLISFSGGNLQARRVESTAGVLPLLPEVAIPIVPKAMIFDESTGQLLLLPQNPGDDLLLLSFDTATGSFGTPQALTNTGGTDPIHGIAFSPDGNFIYFSRGNKLLRLPTNTPTAIPEELPLTPGIHQVYDIKTGPDGALYYLYEEQAGSPQLIGKVTNPNESSLAALVVEEDPFAGTDFCGRIFPIFAPNADIEPSVDFSWDPEEPCANNPVQLTSEISPENYRPLSFLWEFSPPLTDEDGNPLPADFTQEHFLVPAEAAQGSSLEVTLTVTFPDKPPKVVSKSITLTENELQANFSPSDTTLCESCIDLDPLLQAQSGDGGGGGAGGGTGGGGGAGGAGGGTNYEYFWSNKREEGWISKEANEVCTPGLYWVLVREPGSTCYAYAEIRIKMWDVPDQSNNIWYFGDGAGLDFNPDPDDENAPVPRPIAAAHPQNIPAGTSTISDQAGQVLFFTDGQSVWDLNGTLMENGSDIGGSNTASQAVLAVAVPTQSTLFYLFTTQAATSGSNEVRFSLVDIKAENPTGVGNVVTKNNFLFSPSTEHSAALSAGDTTWAVFHELGNNTFRAYPVSSQGIGQSVLSSVGSSHGFNSGVGAMKFSPDGSKLAITISEGGCNRVELFDFNQQTGVLAEYALVDLGCVGDVYGLEFSSDSDRIFLSYRDGGPGIEEYIIKEAGASCPACFAAANTPALRAACILSTKKVLSGTAGLNLGALQIASDGQIYVAVVGSNRIGQIQVGSGCTAASTFNQDAVEAMPGTSNLGLPSFVQNSGSSIPEPALGIPPTLCLDPVSGASATFEGGGEPDIDSYFWTITHEDGTVIRSDFGGPGDQFQNLEQLFSKAGTYTIELRVDRCAEIGYFTAEGTLEIVAPPTLTLASDATLCEGTPVTLAAIDGYDPADGKYDFLWTNAAGDVFGDSNSNTITVTEESIYTVIVQYRPSAAGGEEEEILFDGCGTTASIFVGPAFEFDLSQTAQEVCYEETTVTFAPNTPITGDWFYERDNNGIQVPLGSFFELELEILSLPGPGLYTLTFLAQDPILASCKVSKTLNLVVYELPVLLAQATPATNCATADGTIEITLQAAVSSLQIPELGRSFPAAAAGTVIPITGLLPGLYTLVAENAAGCSYASAVTVENANPPADYAFTVVATDEICSPNGVAQGSIQITFTGGLPRVGRYKIVRQGDGLELTDQLPNERIFQILVPHGEYLVEVIDPTGSGCSIPDKTTYTVDQKFEVQFSVPAVVEACDSFSFTPSGLRPLTYTLTGPSGTVSNEPDGSYLLTQSGSYTVLGTDPTGIDCPKVLPMTVNLSPALDFDVSPIVDCLTGIRFEAILKNANPADVIFLWQDELGTIVGRRQEFVPSRAGNYTLEVQPNAGGLCPIKKIPFTATILPSRLTVSLDALPFCIDQLTTTIEVKGTLTTVDSFEWFLVTGGTRTRLPAFTSNLIEVSQEGTYEVLLRSGVGCELGRANVVVVKSQLVPPVLPTEPLLICAVEGKTATLDPGSYASHSWILDGEEVSNTATFSPEKGGTYTLRVSDMLGCEWESTFTVLEDCKLKVTFPNAMVLEDPNRNFLGYANEYIDDVEVYIYNRWGELIFYCSPQNLEAGQSFCPWDGRVGGKFVPMGTYVVLVRFTSKKQNLTQTETKALTVIH